LELQKKKLAGNFKRLSVMQTGQIIMQAGQKGMQKDKKRENLTGIRRCHWNSHMGSLFLKRTFIG